jgi:hypothetical protein
MGGLNERKQGGTLIHSPHQSLFEASGWLSLPVVMKIICVEKGWAFNPKDAAAALLKPVISSSKMDRFFEQPLTLIATMRNQFAHGAGATPKNPPEYIARYALNATASAILLLVEATGV